MEMRLSIFVALSIFFGNFFLLFIGGFTKRKISKGFLFFIALSNIIALSLIAYKICPGRSTDLYKHFLTVYNMENNGFFVKTAVDNILTIKVLFYIISLIGNLRLISVASVLITYSTFFFLLSKENNKNQLSIFLIFYSIFSFFALCSHYYVFTGIKTSIAFSFLSLFIYNYEKGNKKSAYFFAALSVFSHVTALIFIILFILFKKNKTQSRIFWLFMLLPIVYRLLFIILPLIKIPFASYFFSKLLWYSNEDIISSSTEIFIIDVIYCVLLYFRYKSSLKHCEDEKRKNEIVTLKYYDLFILLSSFISKIMIERGLMLLAFLNFKNIIEEQKGKRLNTVLFLIDFMFFALKIYYFIIRLLSHTTFY